MITWALGIPSSSSHALIGGLAGAGVAEAGLGFVFLAVIISYLPVLYQAFSRREVTISLLDARARRTLVEVAAKYGRLPASKLKTATYLTAPMRALLRKEKTLRMNLFNGAVLPQH